MAETDFSKHEETARVADFLSKELVMDGSIIPLRKKISGKNLSVMIRHITYPFNELDDYAQSYDPEDSVLLINVFANDRVTEENVGFMDWEISKEGLAICQNQQQFVVPQTGPELLAFNGFGEEFLRGFLVEDAYKNAGVGSFLASLSLEALKKLNVRTFLPGRRVTDDAKNVWQKLGLNVPSQPIQPFSLPLAAGHPQVKTSLAKFV